MARRTHRGVKRKNSNIFGHWRRLPQRAAPFGFQFQPQRFIRAARARASYRSLFHFLERSGRQWNNPPRRWHVTRFNGQRLVRRFKGPTSCAKEKPLRETDGNVCGNHLCVTSMAECDEGSLKSLICVLKGPPFSYFLARDSPKSRRPVTDASVGHPLPRRRTRREATPGRVASPAPPLSDGPFKCKAHTTSGKLSCSMKSSRVKNQLRVRGGGISLLSRCPRALTDADDAPWKKSTKGGKDL